jgi:hypothetical protein
MANESLLSHNPFNSFTRGVEGDVLFILGRSAFQESASHIATLSGRSRSQVMMVLAYLALSGLVLVQRYEQWTGHRLTPEHPLTPFIRSISRVSGCEDFRVTLTRSTEGASHH